VQEGLEREQPVAGARASAWRTFVRIAWGATFAYGAMLLWQGFCITGLGPWSTRGIEFFVLVPFAGFLQIIAAGPLYRSSPAWARDWFLAGAMNMGLFVPAVWAGHHVRMFAFELAGERAAPLVAAIERHIAETGFAPSSLTSLVPRWLPELPERVPPLEIAVPGYEDNPWMLRASVPSGFINFDQFVYLPNQNYPEQGWGGSLQRLGRWVYLHE